MPVVPSSTAASGEHQGRGGRSATTAKPHGVQQHTDAATLKRAGRGARASLSAENAAGGRLPCSTQRTAYDSAVRGTSQEAGRHNVRSRLGCHERSRQGCCRWATEYWRAQRSNRLGSAGPWLKVRGRSTSKSIREHAGEEQSADECFAVWSPSEQRLDAHHDGKLAPVCHRSKGSCGERDGELGRAGR